MSLGRFFACPLQNVPKTSFLRLLRSSPVHPAHPALPLHDGPRFSPSLVVFGVEEELLPVAAGMARQLRVAHFFADLPS